MTLFDKEEIHQDLHLIVAESQDESTFVVYGQMYVPTITMPLGLFILYWNDFHSRMSFVPEWSSYCIQMKKWTSLTQGDFTPDVARLHDYMSKTTWYAIFNLELSSVSVFMIPGWNFVLEWVVHSVWKPEWTHSLMNCRGTKFCEI